MIRTVPPKRPYIDLEDDETALPKGGDRRCLNHKNYKSAKNCWYRMRKLARMRKGPGKDGGEADGAR